MPKVFTLRAIEYAVTPGKHGVDDRGRAFIKSPAAHATIMAGTVVEVDDALLKSLPADSVREPTASEIAVATVENGGSLASHRIGKPVETVAQSVVQPVEDEGDENTGEEDDEGAGDEVEQSARRERRRRRV